MNLLRKITDNKICKIQLISFVTDEVISLAPVEGDFSSNTDVQAKFDNIYFTVDTPYLNEDGAGTDPGYQFVLKFGFMFPTNDDRTKLINRFKFLKLIRVHFCNGKYTDIGRNDYNQNKPMEAAFGSAQDLTKVDWSIKTIFPFEFQD